MSKINLKTDYEDGQILHGDELNVNNNVTQLGVNDNYDKITDLQSTKADKDYIDAELAMKVDASEYNSEIALLDGSKATKAEVALKANQSEVDTKASLDYVNTQLATKASTSSVNAQLATKANSSDVTTALALKEDKTTIGDLDDLTTEVKTSIVAAINSIGVVETPIATTSVAGKVIPDGTTITVDQDGKIHSVGGGGTGGTTDYSLLTNKPQINSVELSGNKSLSALGLMSATDTNTALSGKADKSTTYTKTETDNAISVAIADKADTSTVTAGLALKADTATTYSKTAVDDLLSAQASTLNASIATKAPQSTTYTKTETDTAIATKADGLSFSNNELQLKSGNTLIGSAVTLNIVGDEVEIGTTQPTSESNKIWINTNEVSNLGTEVVNSMSGSEITKSPSVNATKTYISNVIKSTTTSSTTDTYSCNYINGLNTYSTTEETICGNYNGSPLYRKVINIGNLPNASYADTATGLTNVTIINIYGRAVGGTLGNTLTMPYVGTAVESNISLSYYLPTNSIRIQTNTDRSGFIGYVTLEYIKNTSS